MFLYYYYYFYFSTAGKSNETLQMSDPDSLATAPPSYNDR